MKYAQTNLKITTLQKRSQSGEIRSHTHASICAKAEGTRTHVTEGTAFSN